MYAYTQLFMPALEERGTISSTTYTPTPTSTPTITSYTQYTSQVLHHTLSNLLPPSILPTPN
ncbi:hypothetical protein EON65_31700, partial [archaeon]